MRNIKSNQGFTLIELMVVLAIMGILSTLAVSYFFQQIETAKLHVVRSQLYEIKQSIEFYAIFNDSNYPDDTRRDTIPKGLDLREDAFSILFFGGYFDYEGPDRNPYVGIAIYMDADEYLIKKLDNMIDDGNLATGKLIQTRRGIPTYIVDNLSKK